MTSNADIFKQKHQLNLEKATFVIALAEIQVNHFIKWFMYLLDRNSVYLQSLIFIINRLKIQQKTKNKYQNNLFLHSIITVMLKEFTFTVF